MKIFKIMSCMFLSGIGIGWLIGLSVSPVLHIVVAGIVSLIVGVTAALTELSDNKNRESGILSRIGKTDPIPITLLIVGLVVGSILGVLARTHDRLGRDPTDIIETWEEIGLKKNVIMQRLFDNEYPEHAAGGTSKGMATKLYVLSATDCSLLESCHGEKLRARLKLTFNSEQSSVFFDGLDNLGLEAFKEWICFEE